MVVEFGQQWHAGRVIVVIYKALCKVAILFCNITPPLYLYHTFSILSPMLYFIFLYSNYGIMACYAMLASSSSALLGAIVYCSNPKIKGDNDGLLYNFTMGSYGMVR
jgi:hypothetical protein